MSQASPILLTHRLVLRLTVMLGALLPGGIASGAPATHTPHIHVDQFGYLPGARKVATIADPQIGYNAAESFDPGPAMQVRRWHDDTVVLEAAPALWNGGATHDQSGDKCWLFDFSALSAPGIYYVFSPSAGAGSDRFEIAHDVYRQVAIQAVRMFFYQRVGFAKEKPYVNQRWVDGAAFTRANQDPKARLISDLNNPATERDLSGGWFDAGDTNKYVTFTWDAMQSLLLAYEENPAVWGDDHGIPESGNGIPDLLDEIKWETDWLLRMQEPNGSVLNRVHDVPNTRPAGTKSSPASADQIARAYGAASTMSTVAAADMYAHAAVVFGSLGRADTDAYAAQLRAAAIKAWTWALANPAVAYDDTGFGSRHQSAPSAETFAVWMTRAASKLYVLTGDTTYRTYFDANYRKANMFKWNFTYVFEVILQDALLYYGRAPGATPAVVADIRTVYSGTILNGSGNLPRYLDDTDPYRAYLGTGDYTWGSSRWKSEKGNMFTAMLAYGLDAANATHYRNAAAAYVHYLHGVNPIGLVYLTNMSAFGAERSASEMYHHWFGHGTDWDNALTSPKGPPPGYLTGGANPKFKPDASYTGARLAPPLDQPAQKAYLDWNTSWPQNSWEVTEPAIYYQAAYIRLLANFLDDRTPANAAAVNLSSRAMIGSGDAAIFPGFVVSGTASAQVLVRAVGPSLRDHGVGGAAADPKLTVYRHVGPDRIWQAENDNWPQFPDQAQLEAARRASYAFRLGATDVNSAALVLDLAPGVYSAKTEDASGTPGIALVEVYFPSDDSGSSRRLVNLSCRARVTAGDGILIPGITVTGTEFATLLIRAVGPGLIPHNVSGVLEDPEVRLMAGSTTIAENNDWQAGPDYPLVHAAARSVYAFGLPDNSLDAAMLVRVPPGSYTIHLSGRGTNNTGIALVEVYHVNYPTP
jgi:hypothetical protein